MSGQSSSPKGEGIFGRLIDNAIRGAGLDKRTLTLTDKARKAWATVSTGELFEDCTAVRCVRNGALIVDVNNSAFLQDLVQFESDRLLVAIRELLPAIQVLKFKMAECR